MEGKRQNKTRVMRVGRAAVKGVDSSNWLGFCYESSSDVSIPNSKDALVKRHISVCGLRMMEFDRGCSREVCGSGTR